MTVCVIGAGPAGMAAALRAAAEGAAVTLIDREARPGGQIGRQPDAGPPTGRYGRVGEDVMRHPGVTTRPATSVVALRRSASGIQVLMTAGGVLSVEDHAAVIVATGAREVVAPFPGWDLPGVMTAGAVQALLKRDGTLPFGRVAVAGSGPLLVAVSAELHQRGIPPLVQMEHRTVAQLVGAGAPATVARTPAVIGEAGRLRAGRPRLMGWQVIEARGEDAVEWVVAGKRARRAVFRVDAVAVSSGLVADVTLARQLDCATVHRADGAGLEVPAAVDGSTSVPGVFVAGEITGVGGADKAAAEGSVAGAAAAAYLRGSPYRPTPAELRAVVTGRRFAADLQRLFPVDRSWAGTVPGSTVLCRCEEVDVATVREAVATGAHGLRAVKGITRVGMGYCQGRMCAPLVAAVLHAAGLEARDDLESRPIAAPVTLGSLATLRPTTGTDPAPSPPGR